jgi:site-specific recombinase XerD
MLTTEACIKQFIDDYSFKLEETTLRGYVIAIRQLLSYCGKSHDDISTVDFRNWLMFLEEKGYKKGSIIRKMFALRLFYRYCVEEELMTLNPVKSVPLPKSEDRLPKYLATDQVTHLRQLCAGKLLQRAIVELFISTGIRLGELTRVQLTHINWQERMIYIPKGKGNKDRIVPFTHECEQHLKAYLRSRNDDLPFVFLNSNNSGRISARSIQRWFEGYRKELCTFISPHTLRHTFAANLAKKGMPLACIQVLLGHENARHTHLYVRLYSHAQKQMYDEWM